MISGFSEEAERLMVSYRWPGNVRELRNVIERIVVLESTDVILPEHLPKEFLQESAASAAVISEAFTLPEGGIDLEELEKKLTIQALKKTSGNKTAAAKLLGVSYDSFRYQIKKFSLE